ncbi:MAG: alpha/beta hydrolase [Candidatus Aenigmarchaeota archaeon]|nr:alpha/beta hydrolase [Candidatus Aenigmarchaeota archaeon]
MVTMLAYITSGLLGYFWKLKTTKNLKSKRSTAVIIHGWLTQSPMLFLQKCSLEKEGYNVYIPEFGWQLGDIKELTEKLDLYLKNKNLKNVILIGNSLGSIISLKYLNTYNGWKRVRKFISISGPFRGSNLAYLAFWFSKSARQMLPDSKFLKELLANIKNKNKITCVSAEIDFIVPRLSSQIKGTNNKIIKVLGHTNLQFLFPLYYREVI